MIIRGTLKLKWLYFGVAGLVLVGACSAPGTAPRPAIRNVFVIVMENKSPEQALSGSYLDSLAGRYGLAENYTAITHPSVPNYLALTSGQTWGVTDDSYHVLPTQDLGHQLTAAGVPWGAYMEGLGSAGCIDTPPPYDPGHNPFAFYGGACPPNVVPLTALQGDMSDATKRLYWITPDMCHDTHDCPVATGDAWLRQTVPLIMGSAAWKQGAVLFITYDEDDFTPANRVVTVVITSDEKRRISHAAYNHYSLLATMEDLLGVGRLANARGVTPMNDLLGR